MGAFSVSEIMHDGMSYDIPRVPCLSVRPYDNFEVLAYLGVRVEYREPLPDNWDSILRQCALRTDNWSKLIETNTTRGIIQQCQLGNKRMILKSLGRQNKVA